MSQSEFCNIEIAGLATALPTHKVPTESYIQQVGEKVVKRLEKITGVKQVYRAIRKQTASDLGFAAAKCILREKNIKGEDIGAIINVTQTPDYLKPSTAFVLQKRLGLSNDCLAFDVNLGCTGYVYGLHIAASLLEKSAHKYALLIVGDVAKRVDYSKRKNPDHTYMMLFGDAVSATLLKKEDHTDCIKTDLHADGEGYRMIHLLGGARCVDASREISTWSDGVERSLFDPYMDGMGVFEFSTRVAPQAINDFLTRNDEKLDDYEKIYIHQANKLILDLIIRELNCDITKAPVCIEKYGNTNGASIPLAITDCLGDVHNSAKHKILLCSFGVGLSWGVISLSICPDNVYPLIYTDEYYSEGEFEPI